MTLRKFPKQRKHPLEALNDDLCEERADGRQHRAEDALTTRVASSISRGWPPSP
jgi:hypothetical protein